MNTQEVEALRKSDLSYQIHPQYHVSDHQDAVIFVRGEGSLLWDAEGQEYIDGLSCLWNVAVGHGRKELAEVAAKQMAELAFSHCAHRYAIENPDAYEDLVFELNNVSPKLRIAGNRSKFQ